MNAVKQKAGLMFIVLSIVLCAMTTPCTAVPMMITEGHYSDTVGNNISLTGLVFELMAGQSELHSFGMLRGDLFIPEINDLLRIQAEVTIVTASQAELAPWGGTDSFGRWMDYWGSLSYTSESFFGQNDPPFYWPYAFGVKVTALEADITLGDRWPDPSGYGSAIIHFSAVRAPEPWTLLLIGSGLAGLIAGRRMFRRYDG